MKMGVSQMAPHSLNGINIRFPAASKVIYKTKQEDSNKPQDPASIETISTLITGRSTQLVESHDVLYYFWNITFYAGLHYSGNWQPVLSRTSNESFAVTKTK
jgi:hypothetical protein